MSFIRSGNLPPERDKLMRRTPLVLKGSVAAVGLAAIGMLLVPARASPGAFVWNFTPSVPLGLYRVDTPSWARGDRVAVRPSARLANILQTAHVLDPGRLLLKRVAATAGDTVCREGVVVSINRAIVARAKNTDDRGAKLPTWSGCEQLGAGQVLLLGEVPESFDGRYFGPTDASDIIGRISPVILLSSDHLAGPPV
jgi:conjugative transfer signal peptidase TraF